MTAITYQDSLSAADYLALRATTDWRPVPTEQASRGVANSLYGVTAFDGQTPVGMGRIVGDGGYIYIIVDVVVHPDYQGQGIGRGLMRRMLAFTRRGLKDGEFILLHLMSVKGKEKFYEKFGFIARPNDTSGCGMHQYVSAEA